MSLLDDVVSGTKNAASNVGSKASAWMEEKLGNYTSSFGSATTAFSQDGANGQFGIGGSGTYSVSQFTYPSDLFSADYRYGGAYAVFYVNVAEESKLVTSGQEATVDIDVNERLRAAINQNGLTTTSIIAGSAALGAGAGTILGALGGGGGGAAGGGVLGGLLGGAAASIVSAATGGKMSRQQKRLKSAIALNIPNQLNVRYSSNWAEEDTAAFQAAAKLTEGGLKSLEESMKNKSVNAQSLSGPAASVATSMALNAPGGVGAGLSAASGLAPNPKKEQIFKGVDFRTFVFDYQFAPRDSNEARNVLNIIKMFKLHMHPEFKDADAFVFVYPSEFDIHYYQGAGENMTIHKHTSCVLTDMNINYTPNGAFNTFADGMPTQINVQMTFKELAILTKEQIQMGF